MPTFSRRSLVLHTLPLLAAASFPALAAESAADYPSKAVKFIVPFPPGGTTDALARLLAVRMAQDWGKPVLVENRAGASATIGADAVAKAAPDGYTLLIGSTHHTIAQAVFPKLPYRFGTDLAAIGMAGLVPNVVVVNSNVPAKTIQELVALAKAQPGKLNYASAGSGSAHHLIGEMFKLRTGTSIAHIPYKGSAPAVADLLGGQVSVMFDTVTSSLPHIKSGKLRALAVTTAKRSSALPDVPTLAETISPGFDVGTWFGFLAPAGTPADIVAKVNAELVKLIADPGMQKQMLDLGIEPMGGTPAQMAAQIAREIDEFATLTKEAKLTIE